MAEKKDARFTGEKVRVGIVGSRFAADFHADSYRRNDRVELVAVAAIDNLEEYSARWKIPHVYADYHEMLKRDDLDLISVCVPNFLHHDVVVACARHGKHVVCEKPFATKVEDARRMLETCREAGIKLMYAEDWVYTPALRRLIEIVHEGGLGKVLYIKAKEVHNGTHSPFAKKKETCGGGCLIHLGVHAVAWVLHLVGENGKNRVVEVTGKTNGGGAQNYVHKDNSGEDFALGILKFENGIHALVEGNYITVGGMEDRIEVYGSEGRVTADVTLGAPLSVYSRPGYKYAVEKADNTVGWTRPAVDEFYNLGYVHELAAFVEYVRTGQEPLWGCSPDAGLATIGIIEALYRSAAEGRTVTGKW